MRKTVLALATGAIALAAQSGLASDDEKPPESYIYGTYFYCDVLGEDAADEAYKRRWAPVYEQAMKDGMITGWGYLKHHTGGKWRRVTYHTGPSVKAIMAASEKMGDAIDKAWTDADNAFPAACKAHDDYVWQSKSGNLSGKRGKVGMSVYFNCNMSMEERADEIVANNFAPIYDQHLGKGKLTSWGWSSHVIGGQWRRLLTMTAEDLDTLIDMRGSILSAAPDMAEGDEFVKICGSHQDYVWDIDMEGRP